MVVQHNMLAMNANRNLNINTGKQSKRTEKLSSGYKINRAADDAAGLAISEKMRRQIRGLTQASANCQDGVSLVQIADGAMAEIQDMLHRGTELSIKAANGTLSDDDRSYIQAEIDSLKDEIQAIREKANFNEIPVLKGGPAEYKPGSYETVGGLPDWVTSPAFGTGVFREFWQKDAGLQGQRVCATIDFGALNSDISKLDDLVDNGFHFSCPTCDNQYSIKFVSPDPSSSEKSGEHYIYNVNVDGVASASDLINRIVSATGGKPAGHYANLRWHNDSTLMIYDERPYYDADNNKQQYLMDYSTIAPGVAKAIPEDPSAVADIYIQAGTENDPDQRINIKLPAISLSTLKLTNTKVKPQSEALKAIDDFKGALGYVSTERSRMGAYQNRLEHTINNLDNVVENTTAAESAIRDTDMAAMMVEFSNGNILAQAGQAMLAQANQSNQGVLSLLQ